MPTEADFADLLAAEMHHFHQPVGQDYLELGQRFFDPARFLGFRCGARWVSTAGWRDWSMVVPGGEPVRTAAVTAVGVSPGYRRRGLLRQMMNHQLRDIAAAGAPIAALWASESGIYGRFGYGIATWKQQISARAGEVEILGEVMPSVGRGSVDEVSREAFLDRAPQVHCDVLRERPGYFSRDQAVWEFNVFDPEPDREGWSALRYALSFDEGGQPSGFASFRTGKLGAETAVKVCELDAADPESLTRLWQFVLGIDLTTHVVATGGAGIWLRPRVVDPRAVRVEVVDGLHIRIIDLAAALASRVYSCDADVVVDVRDDLLATNQGRWRLRIERGRATATRTQEAPHLRMSVTELGAVYLGGQGIGELVQAGRVQEIRRGAAHQLGLAFSSDRVPYCPDEF